MCSDPPPIHCSTGSGQMHFTLLCKTGSQHACVTAVTPTKTCCSHKCAVITTNALQHWFWTNALHTALQNRLTACLCHCNCTYVDLLLTQVCSDPPTMHCSTGSGQIHLPLSSAALQYRLTARLFQWNYTYEDLMFIQVCSEPTPMHCSTGFGQMHLPLCSAALQNRLTAGLCEWNYT